MNAAANASMGELLLQEKRFPEALACFSKAVSQAPFNAEYQNNLGFAHSQNSTWEFGITSLLRANQLKPHSPAILANIGMCLQKMAAPKRALPYVQELVELCPVDGSALLLLGNILAQLGKFDDARIYFERAADSGGRRAAALRALAGVEKQTPKRNIADRIEHAFQDNDLGDDERVALHQAAVKVYSDLKQPDKVFKHALAAKALPAAEFDRDRFAMNLQCTTSVFSSKFFDVRKDFGDSTLTPIFIIGMPRSGSSLAEQILSSHSMIGGAGERPYVSVIDGRLGFDDCATYRVSVSALPQSASRAIARGYWSMTSAVAPGKPFVVDKSLYNFQHLGLVRLLFPKALIIWCRRAPLDCCLSIFLNPLNEQHSYARNLSDLGWYYRQHEALICHWQRALPGTIYELKYENLIDDQEAETRRLLEFIGVPWEDACLRFQNNDRSVATISRWQVRQPLYRTSVERWRPYERYLGPLVDALAQTPQPLQFEQPQRP